jgi:hypothetical protein
MPVRAVAFDIGGVLKVPTDTDLEDRWEPRLGLRPGEFFQRLRQSGLGRDANLGRVSEAELAQALGRLYGLDQPTTEELLVDLSTRLPCYRHWSPVTVTTGRFDRTRGYIA